MGWARGARQWLANCPAKVRAQQPVPLVLVDCYFAQRADWAGLEAFLKPQKWQDLEFLRFAFLSRAAEEQQQELAADSRWRGAVRETDNQLGALSTLLRATGEDLGTRPGRSGPALADRTTLSARTLGLARFGSGVCGRGEHTRLEQALCHDGEL